MRLSGAVVGSWLLVVGFPVRLSGISPENLHGNFQPSTVSLLYQQQPESNKTDKSDFLSLLRTNVQSLPICSIPVYSGIFPEILPIANEFNVQEFNVQRAKGKGAVPPEALRAYLKYIPENVEH
ncbi:MAG: hypothetical protein PHT33_04450 [bacterium]|nr:hypothetical protein [bacterium]